MCDPRQANSTESVALRSPHYRVRRLLQNSGENATAKEEVVQRKHEASNIAWQRWWSGYRTKGCASAALKFPETRRSPVSQTRPTHFAQCVWIRRPSLDGMQSVFSTDALQAMPLLKRDVGRAQNCGSHRAEAQKQLKEAEPTRKVSAVS